MSYPFSTFYEMAVHHAGVRGKKTALFMDKEKVSYSELLDKADRFAGYLHHYGIKEGDRVALFLRNSVEFVVSLIATSKIGAIIVPINTFLKEDELSYILKDSGAVFVVASAIHEKVVRAGCGKELVKHIVWEGDLQNSDSSNVRFADAIKKNYVTKTAKQSIQDIAVLIYTSGTTGKPKGAMLSYKNIFSNSKSGIVRAHITPKDRSIVFLPMFHSFTLSIGVVLMLYVGGSIVIIKSLQPFANIFKQTLLKKVTIFFAIPDVYNALVKAKLPWYFMWFNSIRLFVSGAAALQEKTLINMSQKFKRANLLEGYGLSESGPAVCINPPEKTKIKSVGPAMAGYEIKIVDDNLVELPIGEIGDIICCGDNIMKGYWERREATEETIINGWLLTGDMGYVDEDGYLYIVDRKKDLIISKGINIYPREIEELVDRFEGVKVSAVVGAFDEQCGEMPVAYIELEDGIASINERELKKYLRGHLANYKLPKHIYIIESLPKNATGKVLKRVLKQQLLEAFGENPC
ncbi:MAG: long-chain-fatty-acid--CoA ligase [Sulfurovaceae bacterium]